MMRSDNGLFQPVFALAILLLLLMGTGFGLNSSIAGAGTEVGGCIERERQALLAFKQGVIDYSRMLSGWGSEEDKKDCCKWRGVQCTNTTGHVIALDLYEMELGGNLSSSLFELQHLIYVNLEETRIKGHIPESIGSLKKLKHLDLSFNELSGPIPSQLGNLTSLEFLDLSYSFNSAKNLEWLSHLSSLKYLNMSAIDLSKADDWLQVVNKLPYLTHLVLYLCNLPDLVAPSIHMINTSLVVLDLRWSNITATTFKWLFKFSHSLVDLYLSYGHMQGLIPEALGGMTSLETLDLGGNELEGGIPKSFGNLCRLRVLLLSANHLTGMLHEMISNLHSGCLHSSLDCLDVSNNQIMGRLPDLISNFSSLKELFLSNNNLSGTLTKSIGLLSNLEYLDIHSNNFNGRITEAHFFNLSNLETLDLSSNHLSINISPDWNPPFQLLWLNLGSCMLDHEFPKWIKTQRNLLFLNISHTGISDTPKWFWNLSSSIHPGFDMSSNYLEGPLLLFPANVSSINLSNNYFSGSIFSLCDITGGFLVFLDLSNNQLSGELPDCLHLWRNLQILNLANNHFSGKIPSSFGSSSRLESFSLRNNSLVGEVPWSLGNCSSLQFMDLSYNKVSGMIPFWFGEELPKLAFLLLKSNNFRGSIPLQLCRLTNILLLDFSDNSLSGNIPWCIHNMTALTRKETSVSDHFYEKILS